MSTAEISEQVQPDWWDVDLLELPTSSSRAELRSAALAAVDHLCQPGADVEVAPLAPAVQSYSQSRATERKRQRQRQRAVWSA